MEYMDFIGIDTTRDAYNPMDCKNTMTVGELIEKLSEYDESMPVMFRNDDGYTYGCIYEYNVNSYTCNEDEVFDN